MTTGEVNKNIAQNLTYLRESRGISRKDLAARAAIMEVALSETAIRRIEDGSRPMRADEAAAIASIFNIPLETFLFESLNTQTPVNRALYAMQDALVAFVTDLKAIEKSGSELLTSTAKLQMAISEYVLVAGLAVSGDELAVMTDNEIARLSRTIDGTRFFSNTETGGALKALAKTKDVIRSCSTVLSLLDG